MDESTPLAQNPQAYYAAHSQMSDPSAAAPLLEDLPTNLGALVKVVQGLLFAPQENTALTSVQRKEMNIRPASDMLRQIESIDNRPLIVTRDLSERKIGSVRDYALLLTSFLRQQGWPARVRVGFATYLNPDWNMVHWIAEVWQAQEKRWLRVDATLDDAQKKALGAGFDALDLSADCFLTAAEAWARCRKGDAKSRTFARNKKVRGWPFLRACLVQDTAALNKVEVLHTDLWWEIARLEDDRLTPEDRKLLDRLAEFGSRPDDFFEELLVAWEGDEQFSGPVRSRLLMMDLKDGSPLDEEGGGEENLAPGAPVLLPSDGARLANFGQTGSLRHVPQNGKTAAADTLVQNGFHADPDTIVVRGASQHNLKHVNLVIPRNKMVVITGVSGSGKSSLAFDTLYAEGQRRYVESLSAFVRRYLDQMDKPKVDYIGGLSPAISIEQKSVSKNPRSTVGTVTEVVDYLRVLYSRAGTQHCPKCGRAIEPISPQQVAQSLTQLPPETKFQVIAPIAREKKGDYNPLIDQFRKDGFTRARIDGEMVDLLGKLPRLLKSQPHSIDLIVDRLIVPAVDAEGGAYKEFSTRVIDSVETALRAAHGFLKIDLMNGEELLLTEQNVCPHCDLALPSLSAALFSFNAPAGMCPECNGLGTRMEVDPALIVEHPELSLMDGCSRWFGNLRKKKNWHYNGLKAIADTMGVDLETPWKDLSEDFKNTLLYGSKQKFHIKWENTDGTWKGEGEREERGVVFNISRLFRQTQSEYTRRWYMSFMSTQPCPACGGSRLCAEARHVTVGGKTFPEVTAMDIDDCRDWVVSLSEGDLKQSLSGEQFEVVGEILKELRNRLQFMLNVGLHYLNLSRPAPTLSGGEGQRIRLASQLGCGLVGVLYILDEPSIGLHARDQKNLLDTLLKLRDLGNTVLVVEHDEETMRAADWLIDMGPGAGIKGGEVVAAGTPEEVCANPDSLTGKYLSGALQVNIPGRHQRRQARGWLTLSGARLFNLKDVTARFPLGTVTVVTGVSGSGKSSLISDTLFPALARQLMGAQTSPGPYDRLDGLEQLDKVINITQEPIGRTPRSNPATYVGVYDEIRQVFASMTESKARGYNANRFSFNVKGGRCEACAGHGLKRIEMHFLPDVWVTCQECKGARYNRHTLEITYKGKNIAEVLDMDVQEALEFFGAHPKISRVLQTLHDVGLDYVKLGQSATTLSGGEAQRVKLASELCRVSTGDTIYILDEPTTGLHFADVQRLLDVLHRLADAGNTVVIIEHNMDVIKTADWLIDLGPEGGEGGGYLIAEGTPEQVAQETESYTGRFLQPILEGIKIVL